MSEKVTPEIWDGQIPEEAHISLLFCKRVYDCDRTAKRIKEYGDRRVFHALELARKEGEERIIQILKLLKEEARIRPGAASVTHETKTMDYSRGVQYAINLIKKSYLPEKGDNNG